MGLVLCSCEEAYESWWYCHISATECGAPYLNGPIPDVTDFFLLVVLTCAFDEIHASLCPPLHSIMFNVTRRAWLERNRELMYICISTLFILRQTQWRHTVLSERALYWMQWRGLPCDSFSFRLLVLYDVKSQDSGQKCQPTIYTGIFQIFLGFSARITQHTLWRNLNLSLAFDPWCC